MKLRKDLIWSGIVILGILFLAKFVSLISNILIIGVVSLLFSTILNGPVSFLERKHVPRTLATIICVLIILGFVVGITSIIVPQSVKEFKNIQNQLPMFEEKFLNEADLFLDHYNIDFDRLSKTQFVSKKIKDSMPFLMHGATKVGMSALMVLVDSILTLLIMVYVVCDPKPLIKGFLDPWNYDTKKKLRRCLIRMQKMLYAWAIGLCAGMFCMFILTWIGLTCVRLQGAFLFAVMAGFLNLIPTLGPFIAAVPALSICIVTKPIHYILYVLLVYILMHQVESHIMTPLIMKKQLDVHPMILILSILVMVMFFGMIGAFITAPIMASLSIIYEEFVIVPRKKTKKLL